MPRPDRVVSAQIALEQRAEQIALTPLARVDVFWIVGRSGVGKSVLLLQIMEAVVKTGRRVVWLGSEAGTIGPLLRATLTSGPEELPEFIFVDDLYDRDARDQLDLGQMARLIDEQDARPWPVVVTCGPPEFAESFRRDTQHRGFDLTEWILDPASSAEGEHFLAWYRKRRGRSANQGEAFAQSRRGQGLLVSMAFELEHGDLREFAARFRRRTEASKLSETLRLPLALNRLYMGYPVKWLTDVDQERLAVFNREDDFTFNEVRPQNRYVRLTHPHLGDALYREGHDASSPLSWANDLAAVFARAAGESDGKIVVRLLRVFGACSPGTLLFERIRSVDLDHLASRAAEAWNASGIIERLSKAERAEALASLACWAATSQRAAEEFRGDPCQEALDALAETSEMWPALWLRMQALGVDGERLLDWAIDALASDDSAKHPQWSLVWEHVRKELDVDDPRAPSVHSLGLKWLQVARPHGDWHFVWKQLLPKNAEPPSSAEAAIFEIGLTHLHRAQDNPEWAFLWQDLVARSAQLPPPANADVIKKGPDWLAGREDRPEWYYVWRTLLTYHAQLPATLPVADLLTIGELWLAGREDRPEWTHVWRTLLTHHTQLPATLPVADLLTMGERWLTGREDRPEWTHVWQTLLTHHAQLPATLPVADLLTMGERWLAGREDRPEWAYVWQTLLTYHAQLPATLPVADLLTIGERWLAGREDRPEWNYVWRTLLTYHAQLPATLPVADLLTIGEQWLAGREDRPKWAYVWETLADHLKQVPATPAFASLLAMGVTWLRGRETQLQWGPMWRELMKYREQLPAEEGMSILGLGERWLLSPDFVASPSRGWIIEALLEQGVESHATLSEAWKWIADNPNDLSWRVIAARAVAADPLAPEALATLHQLQDMRGSNAVRRRVATILAPLLERGELPEGMRNPLQGLAVRNFPDGTVKIGTKESAVVTGIKSFGVFVEFRGFAALLPRRLMPLGKSPDDFALGEPLEVFVRQTSEKGIVVNLGNAMASGGPRPAAKVPDQTVIIGAAESATVIELTPAGALVTFRGFTALILASTRNTARLALGDRLRVVVQEVNPLGIVVRSEVTE